jgi:hypothetical protein
MAKAKQQPKKTLYHESFCSDNIGEADGFFEIIDGKLELVDCWSNNDAMWRGEYMTGILTWAGIDLQDLPKKHHAAAEKLLCENWGLDYEDESDGDEEDGEPEDVELAYQEGTSDKVYNLKLTTDETGNWVVSAMYGRRGGNLRFEIKCEAETYSNAKAKYEEVLKQKLNKGYKIQ